MKRAQFSEIVRSRQPSIWFLWKKRFPSRPTAKLSKGAIGHHANTTNAQPWYVLNYQALLWFIILPFLELFFCNFILPLWSTKLLFELEFQTWLKSAESNVRHNWDLCLFCSNLHYRDFSNTCALHPKLAVLLVLPRRLWVMEK